jgi:DNA-binding HxlR family transcriptional regulator
LSNQLPLRNFNAMAKVSIQTEVCHAKLKASRDAIEVIQGKWRIPILICLSFGERRFGEIKKEIPDISPKMLSQELKLLEENNLIHRKVQPTTPVGIFYDLSPLGHSLQKLLNELMSWGMHFRKETLKKK